MKLKCVILDDYQGVALKMADWSVLGEQVEVFSCVIILTMKTNW